MKDSYIKKSPDQEPETVFSKTVLTGKRIYYLDVKKNSRGKLFLIITESKKVLEKDTSQPTVLYERHKIFLFNEDFDKFLQALNEAILYAKDNNAADFISPENKEDHDRPIDLKIEF